MGDVRVDADRTRTPGDGWSEWAVGWSALAGVLLLLQGTWWILAGLVSLFDDQFFVVTEEYLFQFDATTWGWINLVLGTVVGAAGIGVLRGAVWARVVGVAMAAAASVVSFTWIPSSPVWGVLCLVASVAAIWALTAHGRDIAQV